MFEKLFKRNSNNEVVVAEPKPEPKANFKGKTTNEIVEEIHESFYTEVDRLLAEAKILKSTDTQYQSLIDKAAELKSLGFNNTKECKEAEIEIKRLEVLQKENATKEDLVAAIEYFSQHYPLNKFITEESVIKICNKYSLVYGPIDRYVGTVPDKNLGEMIKFKGKVKEEDILRMRGRGYYDRPSILTKSAHQDLLRACEIEEKEHANHNYDSCRDPYYYRNRLSNVYVAPMEIAAPQKDFNMEGMELNGVKLERKIEIPDPVVLHPVQFKDKKYYLIVSAWGLEASDELVVNQKMN